MDEPALREGLPLKSERWSSYLDWAVDAFKLATTVAKPSTQIVTHLCYSEFADILEVRWWWLGAEALVAARRCKPLLCALHKRPAARSPSSSLSRLDPHFRAAQCISWHL